MNLKDFFTKLSETDQQAFAKRAGTTIGYLRAHVLPRRKMPRPALMDGLIAACQERDPAITRDQVIQYFYAEVAA